MVLSFFALAALIGPGAAWAQDEEPLGRNQTEGQLLPDQAEEVAPMDENIDQDTTMGEDIPLGYSRTYDETATYAPDDYSVTAEVTEDLD